MLRSKRQQKTKVVQGQLVLDALSRTEKFSVATSEVRDSHHVPQIDGIADSLVILEDALDILSSIRNDLRHLAQPAIAASAEPDPVTRALFADEYDELRDTLARNVVGPQDAAAVLLSQDSAEYGVDLDGTLTYRIGRSPMALSPDGLGLPAPVGVFAESGEITSVLKAIEIAFDKVERVFTRYSQDKAFLERKLASLRQSMIPS